MHILTYNISSKDKVPFAKMIAKLVTKSWIKYKFKLK